MTNTKPTAESLLKDFGLSVTAVFVPWSKSRNYKPDAKMDRKSLNWRVTLWRSYDPKEPIGSRREVITTDYSAGIGHAPSYSQGRMTVDIMVRVIEREIEEGYRMGPGGIYRSTLSKGQIMPDPVDVIWSLVMDSSAIDYPTYEQWAAEYGYDEDSRKGDAIYRACLEIGLKLRAALGDGQFAKLQEAFQDY